MWRIRKFLQGRREKHRAFVERIPRKAQVAINFTLILVLLFLLYIFMGSPVLHWEQQYRRVERAHMVGPGEILGYEEVTGNLYREIVLAKTDDALIVSTVSLGDTGNDILLYLPKTDGIAVLGAPQDLSRLNPLTTMTVFAVVDRPGAVRAELDLELYWQQFLYRDPEYPVFHLDDTRKENGYFRFDIPVGGLDESSVRWNAISLFSQWSRDPRGVNIPQDTYRATVRLYDAQNELVAEDTVLVRPDIKR